MTEYDACEQAYKKGYDKGVEDAIEVAGNVYSSTVAEADRYLGEKLNRLVPKVSKLKTDFTDCKNELCLKCGNRKEEHLGACNNCRWR